jgi:hypothetical protein
VLRLLERLEAHNIAYRLEHVRDSLMVAVAVPGERWEIEFFEDGQVEVECFVSSGGIEDARSIEDLFERHGAG